MYGDMVLLAEEKGADIVMCNLGYVDQSGKEILNYRSSQPITDCELTGRQFVTELCNNYNAVFVVSWNKLYRRSLFEGIRYPDGKINEDEAVIHRVAHKGNKIVFTSKAYYFYRQQPTSIMNKRFTHRRLDNTIALIDRVRFITNNGYEVEAIYNCELFLINDFISSIRNLNKKNKSNRDAIKEKFNLVKPYCKKLLKNSRTDKDTKKVIRCLLFSPFFFFYI